MPVVYDHGVVHHAEPQDLVRWVQGSLYHTALTQHHIQNHHLQVQYIFIYTGGVQGPLYHAALAQHHIQHHNLQVQYIFSYIQGGSRGRSIMLHLPSITSSTTTYLLYRNSILIYTGGSRGRSIMLHWPRITSSTINCQPTADRF